MRIIIFHHAIGLVPSNSVYMCHILHKTRQSSYSSYILLSSETTRVQSSLKTWTFPLANVEAEKEILFDSAVKCQSTFRLL